MIIKIPPYPNYIITEETLSKSEVETVARNTSEGLSKQLIMFIPFNENERRVIRTRSITHNQNVYISALPNPIHLFLTLSVENFDLSEQIKQVKFPRCGQQIGDDVFLLPIEENGTHQCYNDYIKYRSSSIIMLISALEAFLNHIIPNDFIYKTDKKNYSKVEIESPKIFFKDKLEKVIPQYLEKDDFWDSISEIKTVILNLYNIRKNLIHLKTNAEDDFKAYFDAIDEMLELDIDNCINSVVNFMNIVKPSFIEFEKKIS
jgi:hypothetical protein